MKWTSPSVNSSYGQKICGNDGMDFSHTFYINFTHTSPNIVFEITNNLP